MTGRSVQPTWCLNLPLQQQSVLLLAARGPDGVAKHHPCKAVVRAYRGTVLVAAKYGRPLDWGEAADTFMSLDRLADPRLWREDVKDFFGTIDDLPGHYQAHLMHGAQIVGYKHPTVFMRRVWRQFYYDMVEDLHLEPESEKTMDERLNDWEQEHW